MITGKLTTIARPYAKAAFEVALANDSLHGWNVMLNSAAYIVSQKEVQLLLSRPEISSAQFSEFFCGILSDFLDDEMSNFINLLAENKRLPIFPEVANLFYLQRAEYEKTVIVELESAVALNENQQKTFVDALTKRLKRTVSLKCTENPEIIGGAIVRAGDLVIDGSVKGKLNRLLESL